jgi:hypothetical protein
MKKSIVGSPSCWHAPNHVCSRMKTCNLATWDQSVNSILRYVHHSLSWYPSVQLFPVAKKCLAGPVVYPGRCAVPRKWLLCTSYTLQLCINIASLYLRGAFMLEVCGLSVSDEVNVVGVPLDQAELCTLHMSA